MVGWKDELSPLKLGGMAMVVVVARLDAWLHHNFKHMTNHGEWFKDMQTLDNPGYVETGDDTAHPIVHTGNIPLSLEDGQVKYLADVLHVPNITKNLVSVGQMVE